MKLRARIGWQISMTAAFVAALLAFTVPAGMYVASEWGALSRNAVVGIAGCLLFTVPPICMALIVIAKRWVRGFYIVSEDGTRIAKPNAFRDKLTEIDLSHGVLFRARHEPTFRRRVDDNYVEEVGEIRHGSFYLADGAGRYRDDRMVPYDTAEWVYPTFRADLSRLYVVTGENSNGSLRAQPTDVMGHFVNPDDWARFKEFYRNSARENRKSSG